MEQTQTQTRVSWLLRIVVALLFLQTLFFKFTGAEESVYIFETIGAEPWGRIGSGIVELIASILILIPSTVAIGALIGLGVISGAIFSHLTLLGIVVKDDGGTLFGLAVVIFLSCLGILYLHRREIPVIGQNL